MSKKKIYTVENPEVLFQQSVGVITDDGRAEWFEILRDAGVKKYRVKVIDSGMFREVEIFPVWKASVKKRAQAALESRTAQQNLNDKNKRKHIVRLMNANFTTDDIHVTLTYDNEYLPADHKQAQKDLQNYIRRVKRLIKKLGLPELKYIAITETHNNGKGKVRVHHHVVMNFSDRDVAESLWKMGGRTQSRRLQPDKDFGLEGLGRYLTKSSEKEKNKKSYSTSKNLKQYKVSVSDSKMTRRKANKLFTEELDPREFFEKEYQNHIFTDMSKNVSNFVEGCYLYVRMRNKAIYDKPRELGIRKRLSKLIKG